MRIPTCIAVLSVLSCHAVEAALIKRAADPIVTFASGTIIGTATSVYSSPTATVNAFLGIPFAQSPPLRFAPPKPAPAFSKPFVAKQLAPACIQQFIVGAPGSPLQPNLEAYFNNPTLPPPPESEDCLYLNIYTPKNASPKKQKAVMFWVFGGNLQFGTGSLAFYNGSRLAYENDVVVVTINYRTNSLSMPIPLCDCPSVLTPASLWILQLAANTIRTAKCWLPRPTTGSELVSSIRSLSPHPPG